MLYDFMTPKSKFQILKRDNEDKPWVFFDGKPIFRETHIEKPWFPENVHLEDLAKGSTQTKWEWDGH
jgi:hypothetical protein